MVTVAKPGAGAPRPYRFPPFERGQLSNGARLVVCRFPKLPLATLIAVNDSGSTRDPSAREGTARLTARLLVEGTASKTGAELAEEIEGLGTSLDTGADWDSSIARITFLSEQIERVTELLADVLLGPTFPERELQRLKSERIADLLQVESEPRALADEAFEAFLYSPPSRFAIQSGGSKESVTSISRGDVTNFYGGAYTPGGTTFIAVGDVTYELVRDQLERRFGKWSSAGRAPDIRGSQATRSGRRLRIVDKAAAPQSELRVGHAGLPRKHPDYFPVVVMNAILGGLFGSRINLNLREAHGYTYGASSYFDWRKATGPFVISTAVQTEVTAAALREILLEIDRMRSQPVSSSELSLAKDYLDGVFPIRYESTAAVAAALANMIVNELPDDYYDTYRANVQAVSSQRVLQAAQQHLHPDLLQTLIVGDVTAIEDSLAGLDLGVMELAK